MSSADKVVSIVFQGNDNVSKTVKSVSASMGRLENVVEGVAEPFAKIGDGVLKADAALAALAVGGMALALRESGKFGDSFAEISTLIDGTTEDVGAFRDEIKQYGADSTASLDEINSAIYTAISAGVDYRDSVEAVAQAEKLAVAGKADLEATTRLLASTLNAYGEETDQAAKYSDIFFNTVKLGQTTIPELADNLSQVTGIAASAGVPIETLTASIAALTATGAPTSQAITQIRGAISNIIKPSGQAASLAEELGIEFNAAALQSKGFEGVLQEVYDATDGNVGAMGRLFGSVEGLNAALILGADSSGKFTGALEAMRDAAGVVDAAFEKMAENFELINQKITNNFKLMLVSIGDNLRSGYGDVASGFTDMLQAVGESVDSGAFDPIFDAFDEFAADAGKALEVIAGNLPEALEMVDWSGFIDSLQDLASEFGAVFDGIDTDTPEGLAEVIQAVVDTLESLITVTQGMVKYLSPVWDSIREGIDRFNELDDASKLAAGEFLGAAELVAKAGAKIGLALVYIQKSGADIENVFNVVIGSIKGVWNAFQTTFDLLSLAVIAAIQKIVDAGVEVTKLPFMDEWHEKLKGVQSDLEHTGDAIRTHLEEQAEQSLEGFGQAWDGITGKAKETSDAMENVGESAQKTASVTSSAVGESADEIMQHVQNMMDGTAESAAEGGKKVKKELDENIPSDHPVNVTPTVEKKAAEDAQKMVADISKQVEASVERDLGIVEAETERYESLLEYRLGAMEEQGKTARAAAESVAASFGAAQETMGGLVGEYGEAEDPVEGMRLRMMIKEQQEIAKSMSDAQVKNLEAQARLAEAQAEQVESGEATIQIDGTGLEPHLEAFMYEILQAIQVRATEEGARFLLGT